MIYEIRRTIEIWFESYGEILIKEISNYGIYSNLLYLSLLTILNLRIILALIHIRKLTTDEIHSRYNDFPIIPALLVTFILCFSYSLYCASEFIKSFMAPHLYALEQVLGR